jgi:hypothetical protein
VSYLFKILNSLGLFFVTTLHFWCAINYHKNTLSTWLIPATMVVVKQAFLPGWCGCVLPCDLFLWCESSRTSWGTLRREILLSGDNYADDCDTHPNELAWKISIPDDISVVKHILSSNVAAEGRTMSEMPLFVVPRFVRYSLPCALLSLNHAELNVLALKSWAL